MGIVKQQGILDPKSNPVTDANVIMTAAVIGYAYDRLKNGKSCRIDIGIRDPVKFMKADLSDPQPADKDLVDEFDDVKGNHAAIAKINKALQNGGLKSSQVVQMGVSPLYDVNSKETTITGGSGDMALTDADRFAPPPLSSDTSKFLFDLAKGTAKDAKGNPIGVKLGYQGKGAYTGFVDGRKGGQSALMSTYRMKVPVNGNERRWIPSDDAFAKYPALGAAYGTDGKLKKAWGILINNDTQPVLRDQQGMYFQDEDAKRNTAVTLTTNDLVGYVHGLPQAIYDVEFHKKTSGSGGTPYEIAVGDFTYKRASCFNCAIFMEATGYPASSMHIGKGESWCLLHPMGMGVDQDSTRVALNDKWAAYCQKILNYGITCMVSPKTNLLKPDHQASFTALKTYLANKNTDADKYVFGNLVLDAVTVSSSEYKRVLNTIID